MNKKIIIAIFLFLIIIFPSIIIAQLEGDESFVDENGDGYDDTTGWNEDETFNGKTGEVVVGGDVPSTYNGPVTASGSFTHGGVTYDVSDATLTISGGQITGFDGTLNTAAKIGGNKVSGNLAYENGQYSFTGEGTVEVNGIEVEIANANAVTVSDTGVIQGIAGEYNRVADVAFVKGTRFSWDPKERQMLFDGDPNAITEIGEKFEGTINTNGKETTLPNGATLNGKLSVKIVDGKQVFFVKSGDQATINGVEINLEYSKEEVNIYFDGRSYNHIDKNGKYIPGPNYVSFPKEGKDLNIYMNNPFEVTFHKGNPFLEIEDTDFFQIYYGSDVEITIKHRDDLGLIPAFTANLLTGNSEIGFINGDLNVRYLDQLGIRIGKTVGERTSTPMALEILDKKGNSLLGPSKDPYKYIITNNNEIFSVPLESIGLIEESLYFNYALPQEILKNIPNAVIPSKKDQQRLFELQRDMKLARTLGRYGELIQLDKQFKELVDRLSENGKNVIISGISSPLMAKKLADAYHELPPAIRQSINGMFIYEDQKYKMIGPNAMAWAGWDGIIRFKESEFMKATPKNQYSHVIHEGAHTLTFDLVAEAERARAQALRDFFNRPDIREKRGKIGSLGKDDPRRSELAQELTQEYLSESKRIETNYEDIVSKFERIHREGGHEYGLYTERKEGARMTTWTTGDPKGARHGSVTPHGQDNAKEDIATLTDKATRNPDFVAGLIASGDIDVRKLEALEKGGFLPEDVFEEIMEKVG